MAAHPAMVTPDGSWRVEVLSTRAGQCFRIRHRTVIGNRRGWAATGQLRETVTEVQALLGDAFTQLVVDA